MKKWFIPFAVVAALLSAAVLFTADYWIMPAYKVFLRVSLTEYAATMPFITR